MIVYDPGNCPTHSIVIQGNPVTVLARVQDQSGNNITQSTVSSLSVEVVNVDNQTSTYSSTPSVSSSVFNTLQLDSRWTQDAIGYNLAVTIDGSATNDSDDTYQIQIGVTLMTGETFYLIAVVKTRPLYSPIF